MLELFGIAENLSLGVTGRVGDEVGQFFAAVRGGDVRHDRGGEATAHTVLALSTECARGEHALSASAA